MSDVSKLKHSKEIFKMLIELDVDQLDLGFSDRQRMMQQYSFFQSSLIKMFEQYKNDLTANDRLIERSDAEFEYYFVKDEQLFTTISDELESWKIEPSFENIFCDTFLIKKGNIGKYPFFAFVAASFKSELASPQRKKLIHLGLRIIIHLSTIKQSRLKQERIFAHFRLLFLSNKDIYKNFRLLLDLGVLQEAGFYSLKQIWDFITGYFENSEKNFGADLAQQSIAPKLVKLDPHVQFFSLWRSTLNNIQRKRVVVKTKKDQKSILDIKKPLDSLKKELQLLAEVVDNQDIEPADICCVEIDSNSGLAKVLAGEKREFTTRVITQIIQDQSWVERASPCNDHFFDQDSGQALFIALLTDFKHAHDDREKALLATTLLSFLTGENATNFLKMGKLHPNIQLTKVGNYQVARWRMELLITESKRVFHNNNLRELYVRIPSPLVEAVSHFVLKNTPQNRTAIEIKLRQVAKAHALRIGPISLMRIQRHLKLVLEQGWSNQYIANLLARTPVNQATGSYYGQVSEQKAVHDYQRYVQYLSAGKDSQELENELLTISKQKLQPVDDLENRSDQIIGSQFIVDKNNVSSLFASLRIQINESVNILQHFNAYSQWIWHISLLFLAGRPVIGVPSKLNKMDLGHNLLIVSDKQQRINQDNSRILYIHPFLKQALMEYIDYLKNFFQKYMVFNPKLYEIWQKIETSEFAITYLIDIDQQQSITFKSKDYLAQQTFNFSLISSLDASKCREMSRLDVQVKDSNSQKKWADNWHRHFCYSYLINYQIDGNKYLSKATVNQIMGHEDLNDEFLNPKTSSSALADVSIIKKVLDQLVLELGLEQIA